MSMWQRLLKAYTGILSPNTAVATGQGLQNKNENQNANGEDDSDDKDNNDDDSNTNQNWKKITSSPHFLIFFNRNFFQI